MSSAAESVEAPPRVRLASREWTLNLLVAAAFSLIFVAPCFLVRGSLLTQMDGGMFAYVGQQWLGGASLYADVFEQKPPLIFLANALGLWLGHGNAWGIALALGISAGCFAVLFLWIARTFSWPARLAALASMFLWLTRLEAWNSVGCFSLPLDMAILALIVEEIRENEIGRYSILAGVCTALLFFARPNDIPGGVIYVLALLWFGGMRSRLVSLARFAAGAAIVIAMVLGLIDRTGSLHGMLEAVTGFQFRYLGVTGPLNKLIYPVFAFENLAETGLLSLGCAALVWTVWSILTRRKTAPVWVTAAGLVLLAEIASGALAGRLYTHYIVPALPACGLLTVWFLDKLSSISGPRDNAGKTILMRGLGWTVCLTFMLATAHTAWKTSKEGIPEENLARRIGELTAPADMIYVWSGERMALPFRANRRSASRFFTSSFALQGPSLYQYVMPAVLSDLETRRPRLVADCDGPWLFEESQARLSAGSPDLPDWVWREWNSAPDKSRRAGLTSQYHFAFVDPAARCAVYLHN